MILSALGATLCGYGVARTVTHYKRFRFLIRAHDHLDEEIMPEYHTRRLNFQKHNGELSIMRISTSKFDVNEDFTKDAISSHSARDDIDLSLSMWVRNGLIPIGAATHQQRKYRIENCSKYLPLKSKTAGSPTAIYFSVFARNYNRIWWRDQNEGDKSSSPVDFTTRTDALNSIFGRLDISEKKFGDGMEYIRTEDNADLYSVTGIRRYVVDSDYIDKFIEVYNERNKTWHLYRKNHTAYVPKNVTDENIHRVTGKAYIEIFRADHLSSPLFIYGKWDLGLKRFVATHVDPDIRSLVHQVQSPESSGLDLIVYGAVIILIGLVYQLGFYEVYF